MSTALQKFFAPVKRYLPGVVWKPVRSVATALLTPLWFSYRTGHFRSSLAMSAMNRHGEPLPWYTYPCISFLQYRAYEGKRVLEFGGGQSTLWWSRRAAQVVTFEEDPAWYEHLKTRVADNVKLFHVPLGDPISCIGTIERLLDENSLREFDIIVIDGLYRAELIKVALRMRSQTGAIIADNAEGYGFHAGFTSSGLRRVDFYGHAPGTVLPHCTSIFFDSHSFLFFHDYPIKVAAQED